MEKIVSFPDKVEDLYGLLVDLKKKEFSIRNVGSDRYGTYLYMEDHEEKDPIPVVTAWIGKKAPVPSSALYEKRKDDAIEIFGTVPPPPPEKGFLKKLFGRFF